MRTEKYFTFYHDSSQGESASDILEKIESPLNHLIRNALDHGVETPEKRIEEGKSATATIRLEAKHSAGMLSITVSDDGRGVDVAERTEEVPQIGFGGTPREVSDVDLLHLTCTPSPGQAGRSD